MNELASTKRQLNKTRAVLIATLGIGLMGLAGSAEETRNFNGVLRAHDFEIWLIEAKRPVSVVSTLIDQSKMLEDLRGKLDAMSLKVDRLYSTSGLEASDREAAAAAESAKVLEAMRAELKGLREQIAKAQAAAANQAERDRWERERRSLDDDTLRSLGLDETTRELKRIRRELERLNEP